MKKQTLVYLAIVLATLMASSKLKTLPLLNKLPTL